MRLLVVFLLLLPYRAFAQDCYSGVVVDAITGDSIPGATIVNLERTIGTYASRAGKFRICPKTSTTHLIVSAVGYSTDTVEVGQHGTKLRIGLQARTIDKRAVEVLAEIDGKDIVRRVCQRMDRLRRESKTVRYSLYSLSYRESGTTTIRRTARESTTEVVLTTDQNATSFKIMDRRDLGETDTTAAPVVWDEEMDLSSVSIVIRGVQYPYHLKLDDLDQYSYKIIERDTSVGGQTIIEFAPSPSQSPGFKGTIVLRERDTVFLRTEFDLVNGRNLPYVDQYHVVQTFNPQISRLWFPVRDELTFDVQLWMLTGISKIRSRGKQVRTIVDVEFNPDQLVASETGSDTMNTVAMRSELTQDELDSTVKSSRVRKAALPSRPFEDGFPIPLFGTTFSILPILYRSQAEQMGYGAWVTTRIDSLKIKAAYGSSQDNEQLFGAGLSFNTWLSGDQQLIFSGEYLSSPISVQRDQLTDRTIIRSLLSTAYPGYYSFMHAERAGLAVTYTENAFTAGSRTAVERYATDRLDTSIINGSWLVQDLDLGYSTFPSNRMESIIGVPLQVGARLRGGWENGASRSFYAMYSSIRTSVPVLDAGIGQIRLGVDVRASTADNQTPIPFLSSQVPRFTFQGDPRSLSTLVANDRFAQSMLSTRLTLDLDDIPWRAFDLPTIDGIQPQLSLVFQGLRMWNVQDLQQTGQTSTELTVLEAGFRVSSIPLIITSLFQADIECTWSVDHNSRLQQPFRVTFAITTPFTPLD